MTNTEAIRALCTAIANTFYPDTSAVAITAEAMGLDPNAEATRKDPLVFRSAVLLVRGYVEGSRSENGLSVSVRSEEAIKKALLAWCAQYDLNPEDELENAVRTISDGTHLW